jgi:hypothetical protein
VMEHAALNGRLVDAYALVRDWPVATFPGGFGRGRLHG